MPQIKALSNGCALLAYTRSRSDPGPVAYDVMSAQREATGATTRTTLGSSLRTNDAGGLSRLIAADGQFIGTWPDADGGVAVAIGR